MEKRFPAWRMGIALVGIMLAGLYLSGVWTPAPTPISLEAVDQKSQLPAPVITLETAESSPPTAPLSPPQATLQTKEEAFQKRLDRETEKIGQVIENPHKVEADLTAWARSMTSSELKLLSQTARDIDAHPDRRFLAMDLLGRSATPEAKNALVELATSPIAFSFASDHERVNSEFEVFIREGAIDALANFPVTVADRALAEVLNKVNNAALIDRIQRHRAAIRSQAPSVKDQETEALSRLLGY